jgi:alkylation response protein AidB-like acyl-CoA dehydrogenase
MNPAQPAGMHRRPEDEGLLGVARSLGPLIREHADRAERERRLSPEVIAALGEAGFFRLLLPRSLGGLEVDPVSCSMIVEEIAGSHSAAGWALQAGNAGAGIMASCRRTGSRR